MNVRYLLAVLVALLWSQSGMAKDEGLYLGAAIGSASVEDKGFDFDENDFAWKLFAGYQFGQRFAVEGGYVDFGQPSGGPVKVDPYGWDAFGMAAMPLGPIRLFGKLGAIYWEYDVSGNKPRDDEGVDLAAGIGLELTLISIAIRGEIEYFDFVDDVYMYTLGVTFTF